MKSRSQFVKIAVVENGAEQLCQEEAELDEQKETAASPHRSKILFLVSLDGGKMNILT